MLILVLTFHPCLSLHLLHLWDPQTLQRQTQVGSWPPRHFSMVHNNWRLSPTPPWQHHCLGHPRRLYNQWPETNCGNSTTSPLACCENGKMCIMYRKKNAFCYRCIIYKEQFLVFWNWTLQSDSPILWQNKPRNKILLENNLHVKQKRQLTHKKRSLYHRSYITLRIYVQDTGLSCERWGF